MNRFVECLPRCRRLCRMLNNHRSIILYAPRHYGKRHVLDLLARTMEDKGATCVFLTSQGRRSTGRLDYGGVWDTIRPGLGGPRERVVDGPSFGQALSRLLEDRKDGGRLVFFVEGAARGIEQNHFEFVSQFKRIIQQNQGKRSDRFSVVVTDDYSLFYYNRSLMPVSDWTPFDEVHFGPLTPDEIRDALTGMARQSDGGPTDEQVQTLVPFIHRLTGGHLGLAIEVVAELEEENWQIPAHYEAGGQAVHFSGSPAMESISRCLGDDPAAYCQTAAEYLNPDVGERNNPRVQLLHQIGVLHRVYASMYQVHAGAIAALVKERLARLRQPVDRVGTLVGPNNARIFEPGTLDPHDDDLVVLHISDLHVSPGYYRFRLTVPGGAPHNPNVGSAVELLFEDLSAMGLEKRIDALVLTGDFVWSGGDPAEFSQALVVVEEIIERLGLKTKQVLVIAGNHDLAWNPTPLAPPHHNKPASRLNYENFYHLLKGKKVSGECEMITVVSRSGRVKLRIVGLDSNRVESEKAAGLGYVARETFQQAAKLLERDRVDGYDAVHSWMAVHHHVFPASSIQLEDAQQKRVSLIGNALEVQQYATRWGVEMILHGHEHQPSVTVARRWPVELGDEFAPLTVIGAGSFSVCREKLGPFSRNQYFVLYRRADDVIVRSRQTGETMESFIPHNDIILPQPGRQTAANSPPRQTAAPPADTPDLTAPKPAPAPHRTRAPASPSAARRRPNDKPRH
jgi:3',5'-cyclic AMP phosphodiesterase CpdA